MAIFRALVFAAALSGLLAGLLMTGLQHAATTPLILKAETYEEAAAVPAAQDHGSHDHGSHDHGTVDQAAAAPHDHADAGHDHGDAWVPSDGAERLLYTALANVVGAAGFALLLLAVSEVAGGLAGWRDGLAWGVAAFAAVTLAPSLSLPPELPAMPAADLLARQAWWIGTAVATAAGIALLVYKRSLPLAALAVVLIVLPHLIGAPQPDSHDSPVPASLAHGFVVAVVVTSFVFWAVLGALAGLLRQRFARSTA
ncbi:CbtA family protein [Xanthobacter oligotrophicus]|uniref:CbtA family protein n=1 Tax=Xanthobacter oligotrophicus TaxID=2607286 RepID=UPI0011F0C316|nr:CbtA family protein [Xanthobacter oligotrophicus]MCG5237549.1 CbtA family protein [Xanthobacter oligotrophicus]